MILRIKTLMMYCFFQHPNSILYS
uniref:Uncharacterized protein n=1 Tax=Lepeophtheirus salmonis TaxID=72036 RepID=A0A0K2U2X4_LEPSM